MIAKARADQLVFEQGLAESKEQARRLIMAGKVALAPDEEHPEKAPELVQKPGHPYKITTQFQLVGVERFVSRGAYKLLTALERYHIDVKDLTQALPPEGSPTVFFNMEQAASMPWMWDTPSSMSACAPIPASFPARE